MSYISPSTEKFSENRDVWYKVQSDSMQWIQAHDNIGLSTEEHDDLSRWLADQYVEHIDDNDALRSITGPLMLTEEAFSAVGIISKR